MTYEELLSDDRWNSKRKQIIIRDGVKCTLCYNERLMLKAFLGLIVLKGRTDRGTLFSFMGSLSTGVSASKNIFIKKGTVNVPFNPTQAHMVYIDNDLLDEPFLKLLGVRTFLLQDKEAMLKRFADETGDLPFANNFKELEWKYVPGLHVHHKYYRLDLMPWEYPDDALQTLCWVCHEELHNTVKIQKLDKDGNVLDILTPCYRCYGAGVFPEYKHIKAGLCFRCHGAKYEELILKEGQVQPNEN